MKTCALKYGKSAVSVSLTDEAVILFPPVMTEKPPEAESLLRDAFKRAEVPLEDYLGRTESLLIVVPDRTRRCALPAILPSIIKKVLAAGVKRERIKFLTATGTHRSIGPEAYADLLGTDISGQFEIVEHDADGDNVHIGVTSQGVKVEVNRLAAQAEKVLAVGGMLPHYFAGYGGGPKLIVPGCAGRETIRANHAMSLQLQPDWRPGMGAGDIESNPLMLDIIEAVGMLPPIYHVGLILGEYETPHRIFAGELLSSYRKMTESAGSLFGMRVEEKADMVILSPGGHPKDIDLLQSHKSLFHASAALKDGGVMAVLAECPAGIGSATLAQLVELGSLEKVVERLKEGYIVNGQAAVSLLKMGRLFNVRMMTELGDTTLNNLGFFRLKRAEELSSISAQIVKDGGRVILLPAASITICREGGA